MIAEYLRLSLQASVWKQSDDIFIECIHYLQIDNWTTCKMVYLEIMIMQSVMELLFSDQLSSLYKVTKVIYHENYVNFILEDW